MSKIFDFKPRENVKSEDEIQEDQALLNAETEELNIRKYFNRQSNSQESSLKEIYTSIPITNLCVVNLSTRAGSTFISLNLAKAISEYNMAVSIIENPIGKPYIYDCIGMETKLSYFKNKDNSRFYSYASVIDRGSEIDKYIDINYEGINWLINNPNDKEISEWNQSKMLKLINAKKNVSVNIIDCGSYFNHEAMEEILSFMDMVLVVIDPLPSEIIINEKNLNRNNICKNKSVRVEYIINRWNDGVNKKELLAYTMINPIAYVPFVEPKEIYKSIYECKIPYSNPKVKNELIQGFENIINEILPKNYINKRVYKNE